MKLKCQNMKYECSLLWYDGPFKMVFKKTDNNNYLLLAFGEEWDDGLVLWLGIELNHNDLSDYFNRKITLKNIFKNNNNYFHWITYGRFFGVQEERIPENDNEWKISVEKYLGDVFFSKENAGTGTKFVENFLKNK